MFAKEAYLTLREALLSRYDEREAELTARYALEDVLGIRLSAHQNPILPDAQMLRWNEAVARLCAGEPLAYVSGKAHFYGEVFHVNAHVLIPRPETEELVERVANEMQTLNPAARILDIGTGSGCIPILLRKLLPQATLSACDISADALSVATLNAQRITNGGIQFFQADILTETPPGTFDVLVSNPPYIPTSEQAHLSPGVAEFEPHLALFTPNDDPLVFYRRLALLAPVLMPQGGRLFAEINALRGEETFTLWKDMGLHDVRLWKDLSGRDRILQATYMA